MKKPEIPPPPLSSKEEQNLLINLPLNIRDELYKIDNRDYPYWEDFKHKVKKIKPYDVDIKILWHFIKLRRRRSSIIFQFPPIHKLQFQFNIPAKIQKYLHEFDLHFGGSLESGSIFSERDKNRFLINSIMEEAISSSQLEGASTTREVAKEMIHSQRKPRNRSEKMVLNNYITMQHIVEMKDKKLTKELLLEIHALITKNTLDDVVYEGSFRKSNEVRVVDGLTGEEFYQPPDYSRVELLMNSVCDFINTPETENELFIHPIIRGIILHFLIGYIHPFMDGNGRTARAIFYWYMISKGYWLMEYLSISRIILKSSNQYARAYLYTEYDENDLTYFIDYNLKSMHLALKSLKDYVYQKSKEREQLFHLLINETKLNERQIQLVQLFINQPQKIVTITEIKNEFEIVYQTARTDLLKLVQLGYLKEKYMGKKMFFFRSDEFIEKIKKSTDFNINLK